MFLKVSEIIVKREAVLDRVDELRKGSVDFYSTVKSSWQQKRAQKLRKGEPPPAENIDVLFADVK
jgi:ABC-type transporter lipoprotein component MlaA